LYYRTTIRRNTLRYCALRGLTLVFSIESDHIGLDRAAYQGVSKGGVIGAAIGGFVV
jgi:hypothetical protein